jgi:hypothetical protein
VAEETCSLGVRSSFQTFFQTFSKDFFQTFPNSLEKLSLEKSLEKNGSALAYVGGETAFIQADSFFTLVWLFTIL